MANQSRILICNRAIGMLPAQAIQSLNEDSLEARECNRFYPQIIAEMLEGPHDWSFANRRLLLAQTGNDRAGEWACCYALPADMGTPIGVLADPGGPGLGVPVPLPGDPYAEIWSHGAAGMQADYLIENGRLYTNVSGATLEYGIDSVDDLALPHLVAHAIACELASRLAVPVKKDRRLKGELTQEAEMAWQRAIADDQNRHPRRERWTSAAMAVRSGYGVRG